jgi:hypothetical protein
VFAATITNEVDCKVRRIHAEISNKTDHARVPALIVLRTEIGIDVQGFQRGDKVLYAMEEYSFTARDAFSGIIKEGMSPRSRYRARVAFRYFDDIKWLLQQELFREERKDELWQ